MNFPLYIARRFYSSTGEGTRSSRLAVLIATVGVAVGLTVMILSISIVEGYKSTIANKISGFAADMEVQNLSVDEQGNLLPIQVGDSLLSRLGKQENIARVQPYILTQGVVKTDSSFSGVIFKGLGANYDLHFIETHIVEGRFPATVGALPENSVAISRSMSRSLGLKVGSRPFVYFFDSAKGIKARRISIAAIYETDLKMFDLQFVICSHRFVQNVVKTGSDVWSGIEIMCGNSDNLAEQSLLTSRWLKANYPQAASWVVRTVQELYPSMFSWLQLLDTNVWVILILMLLVAGFTMMSGLLILILERVKTIGMLKSLGSTNGSVLRIFFFYGLLILLRGMAVANVLAAIIIGVQWKFHIFGLDPESYYVEYVPVANPVLPILLLNVAILLLAIIMLLIPCRIAANISPARVVRVE